MKRQHRVSLGLVVAMISAVSVCAQTAVHAAEPATLEKVSVGGRPNGVTVEVVLSRPTMPNVVTLKDPDRFVLEFANTEPGSQPQRTQVERGGIKAVRVGEDGGNPPMTRVVLDLVQPQEYKLVQNHNRITLVPASTQSSGLASPSPDQAQADPLASGDGSAQSRGGDELSEIPPASGASEVKTSSSQSVQGAGGNSGNQEFSRSGSDPTYSPQAQPLNAEAGSTTDAIPTGDATRSTQPEQPAAALLNTLPLPPLAKSPLLGAPIAMALPQVTPKFQSDPATHIQTKNAMLAYSNTVPAMAGSSSTATDPVLPTTASDGVAVTTSRPSRKMEGRKLAAPDGADRDFVIGPGDVLAINVWKEPDISRVIPVRSDGKISLPLVGELQASGETPVALEAEISRGLRPYISEPTVAVIVQEIKSRKYNILGQVTKPGSYVLINSATVLDAIAVAGGFRDFAKKKSIYVLRRDSNGGESRLPFNYTKVIRGSNLEQNVVLRPGDTIVVP